MSVKIVAMSDDSKSEAQPPFLPAPNVAKGETVDANTANSAHSGSQTATEAASETSADKECSLSIVYGNEAQYVGDANNLPDLPEGHTHRWTVYVRPYKEQETATLARIIRKVTRAIYCSMGTDGILQYNTARVSHIYTYTEKST